jgi:hypothetical protein
MSEMSESDISSIDDPVLYYTDDSSGSRALQDFNSFQPEEDQMQFQV